MKIELDISYTKTIKPKENEYIFYIEYGSDKSISDFSTYPIYASIGKTIEFETENLAILNYIKWMDRVWKPYVHNHLFENITPKEKFDEYDEIWSDFKRAIIAESGYNFKTIENEYTDEMTIDCIRANNFIYWNFGDD